MSVTQSEYYVELSSFDDLARLACALQEYPKRVYSQELEGTRIISSSLTLANTLLIFYTPISKSGRYFLSMFRSFWRISCSLFHSSFFLRGAFCPSAENVI